MNPTDFRKICGKFATGVTVLTTTANGEAHGITVNSFTSVSVDPPLILFCIDKKARFNQPLKAEKSLAINILSEKQQEISSRFANPSLTNEERFSGLQLLTNYAYPVFDENMGVLISQLHQTHDGGDHWIYIAKVIKGQSFDGNPLLYYGGSYSSVNSKL
ncbi:MAG: flavin reductase family protein [Bacteroidota bacterium]|nr:flavin reductase family protein [Bacteroidota bacterium]